MRPDYQPGEIGAERLGLADIMQKGVDPAEDIAVVALLMQVTCRARRRTRRDFIHADAWASPTSMCHRVTRSLRGA
jgi:hypothetical protein